MSVQEEEEDTTRLRPPEDGVTNDGTVLDLDLDLDRGHTGTGKTGGIVIGTPLPIGGGTTGSGNDVVPPAPAPVGAPDPEVRGIRAGSKGIGG